jgi:hypothetical protein
MTAAAGMMKNTAGMMKNTRSSAAMGADGGAPRAAPAEQALADRDAALRRFRVFLKADEQDPEFVRMADEARRCGRSREAFLHDLIVGVVQENRECRIPLGLQGMEESCYDAGVVVEQDEEEQRGQGR